MTTHDQLIIWGILFLFFAELFVIGCALINIAGNLEKLVKMAHFKVYTEDDR